MGQAEVIKIMQKNPKKGFTTEEMNKILKFGSATENLRRLYNHGEVRRIEVPRKDKNGKEYVYYLK